MSADANERLESGHFPDTPISDSLMRSFLWNWCETIAQIVSAQGGETRHADHFWASDDGQLATYTNTATLLQPLTDDWASVLAEIEDFFAERDRPGIGESLIFSPWPTPDLRTRGWLLGGHPPLHLLPANTPRPADASGLRVERIHTPDQLAIMERIIIEGYPFPDMQASPRGSFLHPDLLADDRFHFCLGYEGTTPVGIAISYVRHGINQVFFIVTLPQHRGKGYGEALTWHAVSADPALPTMLLSSDLGRPVYQRMGFLPLFRFTVWYRMRG